MTIQDRRQREREEVRGKILEAARTLFADHGYEAVTLRKIAEQIEYSPTAVYVHFRDKEALIRAICEDDFGALARRFHKIAAIQDPVEKLAASGRAYAEFGLKHPNHYRLMFMTPHPAHEDASAPKASEQNPEVDAYAFLRAAVIEAMDQGRFSPEHDDPDLIAQTLWAGVHGVVSLRIAMAGTGWFDWRGEKRAVDTMIRASLHGLIRHDDPSRPPRSGA